jgi:uncharacterized protein (TIGR02594 family)
MNVNVTAAGLNLRTGPGREFASRVVLPLGAVLELATHAIPDGEWLPVSLETEAGMMLGWVHHAHVIPDWVKVAQGEMGTLETPGPGNNPRVVEYHSATVLKATQDSVPWCSAFVNWVFRVLKIARTSSAAAASWLKWGVALSRPLFGCVGVKVRDGGNHVGFYMGPHTPETLARLRSLGFDTGGLATARPGFVILLGGNQGDRVGLGSYEAAKFRGWRWPL